jgi:hypothetical protein
VRHLEYFVFGLLLVSGVGLFGSLVLMVMFSLWSISHLLIPVGCAAILGVYLVGRIGVRLMERRY